MKTRKNGEKLFRVYWGSTTGESLVWAQDMADAMKSAKEGNDFDFVEYELALEHHSDIVEIAELDALDTQELLEENLEES